MKKVVICATLQYIYLYEHLQIPPRPFHELSKLQNIHLNKHLLRFYRYKQLRQEGYEFPRSSTGVAVSLARTVGRGRWYGQKEETAEEVEGAYY